MPDSLVTFQLASAGSPVNLGNEDCYVVTDFDGELLTYEVSAWFIRKEPTDSDVHFEAAQRTAVEVYVANLAQALKLTKLVRDDSTGIPIHYPLPGAESGTLVNPFTSLSVSGLYLTDISQQDDGWRGTEVTLRFQKAVTGSQTPPTFDPDGVVAATNIGNFSATVVVSKANPKVTRYTVLGFYTAATRAAAEQYAATLAAVLVPLPLRQINTATGLQYIGDTDAVKGVLANSPTSLSVSDCYCTSFEHSDRGHNSYSIIAVFEKPTYTVVTDPSADNRVAKYNSVPVGNQPCTIHIDSNKDVLTVVVTSTYIGSAAYAYFDALATALGYETVIPVVLPRGNAGSRSVIKSYAGTAHTLACSAVLAADIENLYVANLVVTPTDNQNIVNVVATFIKPR